jgi:hypothetical protein
MRTTLPLALLLLAASVPVYAITWLVGPTRSYTAPSKVSTLVHDGDTIAIDAGIYPSDVARWTASNLVLHGVGGMAHMKANGANYGGKAIWVISGNNTTVDSIEFSLCTCVDNNGAGIRQEGDNLTVRHCYFHDNQNGILGGGGPASNLLIEYSEFHDNGYGDGYTHNLYIGNINSLTFRFNYSHHAIVGHELKSRAYHNYILCNRLANETTGTASREIDLPNGGTAIILGNEIEQGPQGENSGIIGYGLEGLSNPAPHRLYLVNNTIVNDKGTGTFVSVQNGTTSYKAYNNIFAGPGTRLSGSATSIDTADNLYTGIASAGFADASKYDYHLLPSSPAINNGSDPGFDSSYSLTPVYEYLHPANRTSRTANGQIDIGAHEYQTASSVVASRRLDLVMEVYPNPFNTTTRIRITGATEGSSLVICNSLGEEVWRMAVAGDREIMISKEGIPGGVYYLRLIQEGSAVATTRVIAVE